MTSVPVGKMTLPWSLWSEMAWIAAESQMIIGLRVMGMMGLTNQSPGEPFRMVAEKQAAATESLFAMTEAASSGASADRVMSAALRPYRKRTKANSRRLGRARP